MNVFVIAACRRLDASQRAEDRVELVFVEYTHFRQRMRPCDRPFDVVVEQLAVERERVVEPPQQRRRLPLEAPAPKLLRQPAAFRSRAAVTSSAGSVSSRLFSTEMRLRPRVGRPKTRMKPAASRAS